MKNGYKVLVVLLLVTLVFTGCSKEEPVVEGKDEAKVETATQEKPVVEEKKVEKQEEKKEPKPVSGLSGVETTKELAEQRVVGIMLDNHPNARWQAGLREAEVVYEILVEGDFTRYLAMYQVTNPSVIGPVRSVRTPFITRIMETNGILAHFGASYTGDEDIANYSINNIDGMAVAEPVYYRNHNVGKVAPHNAYTNMDEIRAYAKRVGYGDKNEFKGYEFYEKPTAPGGEKVVDFTIYIRPSNRTNYEYQEEKGIYHRYKDGDLHIDENDREPLEVTNIIVQFADSYSTGTVHKYLYDEGEGKGLLFTRGEKVEITWKKADRSSPTEFFDKDGKLIKLNVGQTFIQIVDSGTEIASE